MTKDQCRHCAERTAGCHTRCPDGIEQDRRIKGRREKVRAEKDKDTCYSGYKRDAVDKRVKRAY